MRSTSRKRASLVGAGAAAAVLGLASTAFACTFYQGKTTVTDVNNGVTSTASADGDPKKAHSFCLPGGQADQVQPLQPVDLTGTFTVTVGVATLCNNITAAEAKADAVTYTMNWATPKPDVNTNEVYLRGHCDTNDNDLQSLSTIAVDSDGNGVANPSVPATNNIGPAAVCFVHPTVPATEAIAPPEVRLNVI